MNRLALLLAPAALAWSAAARAAEPPLVNTIVIEASPAAVWKAFTTREGAEAWMVAHAEIDLRVGGAMKTHYSKDGVIGDAGSIENAILAFDPEKMLAIRNVKSPASFPFKTAFPRAWTIIYLEPLEGGKTRVTCKGLGWESDEESRRCRAFFDAGNQLTLERWKKYCERPGAER